MMTMSRSFLTCRQQVPQCVRPYQGPFLDGRLLLRLLSSRHAGGGGGSDEDDNRRRRRLRAPIRDGRYWRSCCPAWPFFSYAGSYAGVTSAAAPKSPHRSRWRARPWRATVPQYWPAVPRSPRPSARPSCRADSLSAVGGLSGPLHAWTSAASDEAAGSCSHWGCWRRTPKGCWSGPSRCRLPAVWRRSAAPWPGCIWHRRAYVGCKGSRPGDGGDTVLPGCGGGSGALLTPLLRRRWPATTTASGAPATDSCCTVPCCHGEGVQANEAPSRTGQSLCPSQQQQRMTASRWGRGGEGPSSLPPLFSGLRGGSTGKCLWKVLIRKQGVTQAKFIGCWLVEVNHHIAVGPGGRGVATGGCQQAITAGVYLLVQVGDLGHVPGVLEQDDVSSIQADGPVAGVFVKNILDQMNDGRVIMMGPAREPRTHQAGLGCLHVVDDDQSSGLRGQLLSEVLSPRPAAVQGTELAWPVPRKPAAYDCKRPGHEWVSWSWP